MQFEFDAFIFDEARYELRMRGARVELDAKALDLLGYLVRRPGQLVKKDELFEAVWPDSTVADNALAVAVSKLRKAFLTGHSPPGSGPSIENVYGRGYRLLCSRVQVSDASSGHDLRPRESGQLATDAYATGAAEEGPLVGRDQALVRLEKAWQLAQAGRGNVTLLTGEPGIGKTRLAEEFSAQRAHSGAICAWGQFRPFGSVRPLAGWLSVLRECARLYREPTLRQSLLATAARLEATGLAPGSLAEAEALPTVMEELSRTLLTLARAQATVVFLDDVQWADSASLQLLAQLVGEIGRTTLLIVVTLRAGEPLPGDRRKLLDYVAGHRNAQRAVLRPLGFEDVSHYVSALFGNATEELKQAVFNRSEGTPFFMVQLLRPHRGGPAPSQASITLTGESYEIVRQRLDALDAQERELLRIAAVLGRRVDLALLGQLTGRDALQAQDALQGARAAGLLRAHPSLPAQLEFEHEVIVTVLGEEVSADRQACIHLDAARALGQRAQRDDAADPLETLLHRLAASPHGEVRAAVEEAQRAASDAAHYAAHGDACALLSRALQAMALAQLDDVRLEAELWVNLAFSARVSGHPARSDYLERALRLAESNGFADLLALVGMQMSPIPGALVERGAGRTLAAAAQALTSAEPALLARVLAHQSWTPPFSFSRVAVEELASRALVLATRAKSSEAMAAALSAQAYFARMMPEPAQPIALQFEEIFASAPPVQRSFWRSRVSFSGMISALQQGDLTAFSHALTAYGAAADTPRKPELLWHHERACTIDRLNRGDYAGAGESFAALADKAHQLQLEVGTTICLSDQFMHMRETSGVPTTLGNLSALSLSEADSPCVRARKLRAMAELEHPDAAQSLEAFSPEAILSLPADRDCVATFAHLAIASIAARSRIHCELMYRLLLPHSRAFVADLSLHAEGSVEHFLGLLAVALGRAEDAEQLLTTAALANDRAGFKVRALHSQAALAELLQTRAPRRAHELARELSSRAHELGLKPLLQRAAAVLQS